MKRNVILTCDQKPTWVMWFELKWSEMCVCVCVCVKHVGIEVSDAAKERDGILSLQLLESKVDHSVYTYTPHTHTTVLWPLIRDYPGRLVPEENSPTHTHPDHRTSFINFLQLLRSIASSVFSLCDWQSSLTTSLQVLFGLPLGLGPSTLYSMHFFTQSLSSFRSTYPYQGSLFCCNTNAMSSILPELIPTNSNSGLHSCISISIHTHHVTIDHSVHFNKFLFVINCFVAELIFITFNPGVEQLAPELTLSWFC